MDQPRLSALSIRLAAAVEIEPIPLLEAGEPVVNAKQAFLQHVCNQANRAGTLSGDSLDRFLLNLREDIATYDFGPAAATCTTLADSRARLVERLTKGCGGCGKKAPQVSSEHRVCESLTDPQQRGCIAEVLAIAWEVEQRARKLHQDCVPDFPNAQVELAFASADPEEARGLYQFFSASGWTELLDAGRVRVGLAVKDEAFNRSGLYHVLYILAHELSCHAFQGVLQEPRPEVADERCSWSEGWMDALAWTFTEAWIDDGVDLLPEGLEAFAVKAACMELHNRRYVAPQPSVLNRVSMGKRDQARRAFYRLENELDDTSVPEGEPSRASRFSIMLNVAPVSLTKRELIASLLRNGLLQSIPSRRKMVVDACAAFIDHRDVDMLESDLVDAVNGVLAC